MLRSRGLCSFRAFCVPTKSCLNRWLRTEAVRLSNYNISCTATSMLPHKLPEGQKLQVWALPSVEGPPKPSETGEPGGWAKQNEDPMNPRDSSTPGLWREGHHIPDNKPSLLHQEWIRLKDLHFMCVISMSLGQSHVDQFVLRRPRFVAWTDLNKPGHWDQSDLKP